MGLPSGSIPVSSGSGLQAGPRANNNNNKTWLVLGSCWAGTHLLSVQKIITRQCWGGVPFRSSTDVQPFLPSFGCRMPKPMDGGRVTRTFPSEYAQHFSGVTLQSLVPGMRFGY